MFRRRRHIKELERVAKRRKTSMSQGKLRALGPLPYATLSRAQAEAPERSISDYSTASALTKFQDAVSTILFS